MGTAGWEGGPFWGCWCLALCLSGVGCSFFSLCPWSGLSPLWDLLGCCFSSSTVSVSIAWRKFQSSWSFDFLTFRRVRFSFSLPFGKSFYRGFCNLFSTCYFGFCVLMWQGFCGWFQSLSVSRFEVRHSCRNKRGNSSWHDIAWNVNSYRWQWIGVRFEFTFLIRMIDQFHCSPGWVIG